MALGILGNLHIICVISTEQLEARSETATQLLLMNELTNRRACDTSLDKTDDNYVIKPFIDKNINGGVDDAFIFDVHLCLSPIVESL